MKCLCNSPSHLVPVLLKNGGIIVIFFLNSNTMCGDCHHSCGFRIGTEDAELSVA